MAAVVDSLDFRLAHLAILCHKRPNAHHQVSFQLDYRGDVQNMNSQHFSNIMYRAHTNAWEADLTLPLKGQMST